jgi:nucleotide-binding universal stress UspA family protein
MGERAVQDLLIVLSLLFTGLIAINVVYLLMVGDAVDNQVTRISKTTAVYVVPWAGCLALLLIARELWLIRIYMEGIHIGFELEGMLKELKRIESIERKEEKLLEKEEAELEKIERFEKKIVEHEEGVRKKGGHAKA